MIIETVKNKLALWYKSEGVKIVTIPAIVCKNKNSKLFGTTKPRISNVRTWTKRPNLESKKALKSKGIEHKGTT